MEQIWKPIDGFDRYEVSNAGQVRNKITGRTLKPYNNGNYYQVKLKDNNGEYVPCYIHRLVAISFLNNPNNYPCINHKDENKLNNDVSNLEWCDYSYNNSFGTIIGRSLITKKNNNCSNAEIEIYCLKNGEIINKYKSIHDAARRLNLNVSNICQCIHGNRKTCGGYSWEMADVI